MSMDFKDFPTNHQELFQSYYVSMQDLISEFSGNFLETVNDFNLLCEKYAADNGLNFDFRIGPEEF